MNQQEALLQHLVTIYKEKGIPLDALIKSPFFHALPIEKKLEIIKKVGVSAQSRMGYTNSDVKKLLLGLGLGILGGGLMGMATSNYSSGIKYMKERAAKDGTKFLLTSAPIPIIALTAATSLLGTSGSELGEVYTNHMDRQALRKMDLSSDNSILQHLINREN
jgi:hypothetical protein